MRRLFRPLALAAVLALLAWAADYALRALVFPRPSAAAPPPAATSPVRAASTFATPDLRQLRVDTVLALPHRTWWLTLLGGTGAAAGDAVGGRINWAPPGAPFDTHRPSVADPPPPVPDARTASRSPALGLIFQPRGDAGLTAVDERSLTAAWQAFVLPADQTAVAGDLVLVAAGDRLTALDALTGAARWAHTAAARINPGLTVSPDGDLVLFTTGGRRATAAADERPASPVELVALDPRTGSIRWARRLTGRNPGIPAAAAGRAVLACDDAAGDDVLLTATDLRTGSPLWERRVPAAQFHRVRTTRSTPAGGEPWPAPALDGRRAYQTLGDTLFAVDAATGAPGWAWPGKSIAFPAREREGLPPPPLGPPTLAAGRLFLSSPDDAFAIDPDTGRAVWVSAHRWHAYFGARPYVGLPTIAPALDADVLLTPVGGVLAGHNVKDVIAPAPPPLAPWARPIPVLSAWGGLALSLTLAAVAILLHHPRLLVAGLSAVLLAAVCWRWVDSYRATTFVGRKWFPPPVGQRYDRRLAAETRAGVHSRAGRLLIGYSHSVYLDVTRPPQQGNASEPLWLTRSDPTDPTGPALPGSAGPAWTRYAFPTGSALGPRAVAILAIPHWPLAALLALTPLAWLAGWRDRRRYPKGHCPACGYDLRASTTGTCPECGRVAA